MAHQGYEHDDDELKPIELKIPFFISCVAWFLVAVIAFLMYKYTNSTSLAFGQYLIDAIAFFMIGIFFYFLHVRLAYHNRNAMELKIISAFAGIASLVKFVLAVIDLTSSISSNPVFDAYILADIAIWLLLTIFFFLYWWRMHDYDFDGKFNDGYEDED